VAQGKRFDDDWHMAPLALVRRRRGRDNQPVLASGHLYGNRVWFHDTRSPARRMGVSTHPVDSTVVISFWQGDACTGTFRLPVEEAARLISTLGYAMADALPSPSSDSDHGGTADITPLWSRLWNSLNLRLSRKTHSPLRLLK
jgi:hypothetical protein